MGDKVVIGESRTRKVKIYTPRNIGDAGTETWGSYGSEGRADGAAPRAIFLGGR